MKSEGTTKNEENEKRRVLVVDDDKDFATALADILEFYGYRVEKAHNELDAMNKMDFFPADVALLDIRLGNENGINLINKIKERCPNILVIMMTAYAGTETAIEAFHAGAYDYLQKPLNHPDLLTTLNRCFEIITERSERRKAEEASKIMEAQLQQARKMEGIGTLAGGIAHDFNNSLQAILGYTQILLLNKTEKDADYPKLRQIEKAATSAAELTKQLLAFSRNVPTQFRPLDLNMEIRQIEKLLTRTIPKMIGIKLDLEERLDIINADPFYIEQIIMNLVLNARDAMGEEGRLILKTENATLSEEYCKNNLMAVPGDYVLFTVSDTGHGMDKETMERIFEPFFTTKDKGKGSGLGLSMVYGLVKKHDGNILCYSESGKGTAFMVYFPVIKKSAVPAGKGPENAAPPRGSETILIVDDEALVRDLGEQILKTFGYKVITAPDGERGLEAYLRNRDDVSLVILDLLMPGMGGRRCLEELIKISPDVKVIISSGYSPKENAGTAMDAGAKGFISKPYDVRKMLTLLRDVLDAA